MRTNAFALTRTEPISMNSTSTATESMQPPMSNGSTPLIRLSGVTKVFLTDEVETHALSGIHLDIRTGEYVAISGPSGCGKSALLSILGLLDMPSRGSYAVKGNGVSYLSFPGSRPHPQSRNRLHFSKLQFDRRLVRLRKCRTAVNLSRP